MGLGPDEGKGKVTPEAKVALGLPRKEGQVRV